MITVDSSNLPVLAIRIVEPITFTEVQAFIKSTTDTIADQQPFAIVLTYDGGDEKKSERGAGAMMMRWLKQNKSQIVQLCAGVATVIPNRIMFEIYKPMTKFIGSRIYGCPHDAFREIEHASVWAQTQLSNG